MLLSGSLGRDDISLHQDIMPFVVSGDRADDIVESPGNMAFPKRILGGVRNDFYHFDGPFVHVTWRLEGFPDLKPKLCIHCETNGLFSFLF